uniref:Uncharacterized protein n=1 Tax=Setaria viridis TaxID=4556 RepID=A0A4U6VTQ4_SETVI|nr:hypothetical protein SEVIR_2G093750v2 [Setaria viridis]
MEFLSSSSTPWCGGLHESDVGFVVFPNSGELFGRHYSSLAEGGPLAELPPVRHHRPRPWPLARPPPPSNARGRPLPFFL